MYFVYYLVTRLIRLIRRRVIHARGTKFKGIYDSEILCVPGVLIYVLEGEFSSVVRAVIRSKPTLRLSRVAQYVRDICPGPFKGEDTDNRSYLFSLMFPYTTWVSAQISTNHLPAAVFRPA